ncbi:MAG: biotin--[acetyl-CoA-carboxylase] ligase [Rhodobacteraceae bacterium]|nr:biotin--[acetyl-CoA-carboxylase] ligase [Paracoccaceae bacterium]
MGWPSGYRKLLLDEVDSTLNEAARIAPYIEDPVWILAKRQTSARGRRGRAWQSPEGNLSATLVLRPNESPDRAALRSFVAALALYDACVTLTGRAESLSLKWPNDVLFNGGKLAGILLESSGQGGVLERLSIGIGVNLAEAPGADQVEDGALRPVCIASETGLTITPEDFLTHLAQAYAVWEARFASYGFAPIRDAWLSRAARLGETITARTGTSETVGRFETVDETGNLVLNTAKGRAAIPAADIYF